MTPNQPSSNSIDEEIVIEVRVKYEDFMNCDQLTMLSMFRERSSSEIKRKVVDEIVKRIVAELDMPDIDLSDLKERIKEGIVNRKIDEVLEND